eukprot:s2682_g16.t1
MCRKHKIDVKPNETKNTAKQHASNNQTNHKKVSYGAMAKRRKYELPAEQLEVKEEKPKVKEENAQEGVPEEVQSQESSTLGLRFLSEEEQTMVVTMPECLKSEIGLRFEPNVATRARFNGFFVRYAPGTSSDHKFTVWSVGYQYQASLVTPSLYGWTFLGYPQPTRRDAEDSACDTFLQDERVVEIASKLPPPASKVRRWIALQLRWIRKELMARGINLTLVVEEAKQELFSQFRAMGCRNALWDGNA